MSDNKLQPGAEGELLLNERAVECVYSGVNRRTFLRNVSAWAGAAAVSSPSVLSALNEDAGKNSAGIPMRVLGRTGERVTIVGLGTAPVGYSKPGQARADEVFEAALDAGINYVDTAHNYGEAENYLSALLPRWRDKIFLAAKALPESDDPRESARQMQEQFEDTLRRLKTTHVDLLHIHSIGDRMPETVLAPGGPLEFVRKMKEKGLARFAGVTGHNRVPRFAPVIDSGEIDVVMVALNFADFHQYHFEEQILPVARRHGCGILAMKVYGGHAKGSAGYAERGPAKIEGPLLENAFRYSAGIEGVAAAVIGFYGPEEARQSVEWARRFRPLTESELASLREKGRPLAAQWGPHFGPAA
ncbi:MAG TPA: aldo/keto reductase [Verrucomicrobiae bacterium]